MSPAATAPLGRGGALPVMRVRFWLRQTSPPVLPPPPQAVYQFYMFLTVWKFPWASPTNPGLRRH